MSNENDGVTPDAHLVDAINEAMSEAALVDDVAAAAAASGQASEAGTGTGAGVGAGSEPEDVAAADGAGEPGDAGEGCCSGDGGEGAVPAEPSLEEQLAAAREELARARADHFNLSQEYSNFVRRSRAEAAAAKAAGEHALLEALVPVLDDIHLAREHGDLTGPVGAIAEKLEHVLASRCELERFGAAGDEFDPTQHEALFAQPHPEVSVETVHQVIQPGYRAGQKVLRAARVAVHQPE
ncbi:nucleotide exchange factor GrpE [Buchananella felis]|uniref:nucleotide exchange factor GrpE n=1 Tax=Buchananella felis TaxID=3231492 RepID=UPI0035289BC2